MSRVGKKPLPLPSGVTAAVSAGSVAVKGPKGELTFALNPRVTVALADSTLTVDVANHELEKDKALWGMTRRMLENMVTGVTKGFEKKLEVNGIGYKVSMRGNVLVLDVGYSHEVEFPVPAGVAIGVEKNVITVAGTDRQRVGEVSAQIRRVRKPEPYKGKGIKYQDEVIRRKAGKAAKAGA